MKKLFVIFSLALISACGGSSSGAGVLIEGILTEGGGAADHSLSLKHAAGENIEEVKICALGKCSHTDGQGQWGFVVNPDFTGGEVLFSIDGHGINTSTVVNIPEGADSLFIHFEHVAGGKVALHHMETN